MFTRVNARIHVYYSKHTSAREREREYELARADSRTFRSYN
jgi:hypothetical protein